MHTQTIVTPAGTLVLHDRLEIRTDVRRGDLVCFQRTGPRVVSLRPAGDAPDLPCFRAVRGRTPGLVVFESLAPS